VLLKDGSDGERFLKVLHERCWLAGFGWMMVGTGGQLLERLIVGSRRRHARALGVRRSAGAGPAAGAGPREPATGEALDTVAVCPPLTIVDEARLKEMRAKEAMRLAAEREKAREAFIVRQAKRLAKKRSINISEARKIVALQIEGVVLPDVELPFDDAEFLGFTVADVLMNPGRFVGATLADPIEGLSYGSTKALVMRRADGSLFIKSFAHGHTVYELRRDYRAIQEALKKSPPNDAASLFVRLVLDAELDCIEIGCGSLLASSPTSTNVPSIPFSGGRAKSDWRQERKRSASGALPNASIRGHRSLRRHAMHRGCHRWGY
jgi:hypothetical protein